jgi:hypothetical protein
MYQAFAQLETCEFSVNIYGGTLDKYICTVNKSKSKQR